MKTSINLTFYNSQTNAFQANSSGKVKTIAILKGSSVGVFIREPSFDSLPKGVQNGDILTGSLTYIKKIDGSLGNGTKPGGYPISYYISDTKQLSNKSSNNNSNSDKSETLDAETEFNNSIRDAKIKFIKSIKTKDILKYQSIIDNIISEYQSYLPLRLELLHHAMKKAEIGDKLKFGSFKEEDLDNVLVAADNVLNLINQTEVASELGLLADKDDESIVSTRKECESKKSAIIDALFAKANIYLVKEHNNIDLNNSLFISACKQLSRWEELSNDKNWLLFVYKHKFNNK